MSADVHWSDWSDAGREAPWTVGIEGAFERTQRGDRAAHDVAVACPLIFGTAPRRLQGFPEFLSTLNDFSEPS